jgi:hypothetical protein
VVEIKAKLRDCDRTSIDPLDLMERVRNCVYWTPGLTMADIAEEGIRHTLAAYEKKNGGAFPQRKANLKGGRPVK